MLSMVPSVKQGCTLGAPDSVGIDAGTCTVCQVTSVVLETVAPIDLSKSWGLQKCLETSCTTLGHLGDSEIAGTLPAAIGPQNANMSQLGFEPGWRGYNFS